MAGVTLVLDGIANVSMTGYRQTPGRAQEGLEAPRGLVMQSVQECLQLHVGEEVAELQSSPDRG